jgi:hypothetical protein
MKKLFAILALASVLTACNNSGEDKAAATDSPKVENPVMDAVKTADSAATQMVSNAADSGKKAVNKVADSAGKVVEKVKDAVKH